MDKNNLLFCVSEGVPSEEVQRVRGVRQAPEAQEGSAVSHSRGVSRLDACVPSRNLNLQLRLFLTGASEPTLPPQWLGWVDGGWSVLFRLNDLSLNEQTFRKNTFVALQFNQLVLILGVCL